ncbi:MAG TPA: IPT/TIG domain-containing protein [Longimicrobiales bacterium]|nr:IPT/TIG domain-containing protein [Longimicrobiales bacterium]
MRPGGRRPKRLAAGIVIVAVATAAGCNSTGTTIQAPPLEVLIASGDAQFGVVNEDVGSPLRVVVRSEVTQMPREDVSVLWEVTQGSASVIGVATTVTDSTGSTEIRLSMGGTPGEVRVRASVADQIAASATFQLYSVHPPTLTGVAPDAAAAGATVTLTGSDFSTIAGQNVVLFSGIRGAVVSATSTTLEVQVPPCLPARDVNVSVQLGVVPSQNSAPLTITGGGLVTTLQPGEVLDVADDAGLTCHALAGETGAEYLTLVYSASPVGAAKHAFELSLLSSEPPPAAVGPVAAAPAELVVPERWASPALQERWDQRLRTLEDALVRARRPGGVSGGGGPARVGPAAVPAIGETRTFNVLNTSGGFDQVTAEAEHVGSHAAIFVDVTAPPPDDGFSAADLATLAARFDQVIHPTVTAVFGSASDVDANQRIIILLTPAVNRLTPRNSNGFIGGFFYGVDLLTTSTGSNQAEIFYALVPDPSGEFSDPHTKQQVLTAVPAVLAHEFQHMVHFNERVLVRDAGNQDALWLSEALAQMAEELVARAYTTLGDAESASLFRAGAVQRARRYLRGPDTVSVVVTAGQGSLAERGAGFLELLWLGDQRGTTLLGSLTKTTRTGVANVEAETGEAWPDLLADWWGATYLDGPGPESGPLTYPTIDLRAYLGGSFPLEPGPIGPADARESGSLWSSSVRYYLVSPPLGGTLSVRLGGASSGPIAPQSALRLRVVRIS